MAKMKYLVEIIGKHGAPAYYIYDTLTNVRIQAIRDIKKQNNDAVAMIHVGSANQEYEKIWHSRPPYEYSKGYFLQKYYGDRKRYKVSSSGKIAPLR